MTGKPVPGATETEAEQRLRFARDGLPGRRDALESGALGGVPVAPQGDENREPPPNAPVIPE